MNTSAFQAVVGAPCCALGVLCGDESVREIVFLPPRDEMAGATRLAREAARQLRAYLADPRVVFDLPLAPAGSEFQRRVWRGISAIPLGATRTYGELAAELHSAPRAVGQACGRNPYPLVVPCHRVVAGGGARGGFP